MDNASFPDNLITAMAPWPGAVAGATIVSDNEELIMKICATMYNLHSGAGQF